MCQAARKQDFCTRFGCAIDSANSGTVLILAVQLYFARLNGAGNASRDVLSVLVRF